MFDQKAILLTALLKIQEEGPSCPEEGICFNVEMATFNTQGADNLAMGNMMSDIWSGWPEYSDNPLFPVPYGHVDDKVDPDSAFYGTDDLWVDEYGDCRKRLLSFLITVLQEETEMHVD